MGRPRISPSMMDSIPDASEYVNAVSLAANVAESITVPTWADAVILSATADFYLRVNATATVPGDTTDGTASALNPTARKGIRGKTLSVISASTCVVTAEFVQAL